MYFTLHNFFNIYEYIFTITLHASTLRMSIMKEILDPLSPPPYTTFLPTLSVNTNT